MTILGLVLVFAFSICIFLVGLTIVYFVASALLGPVFFVGLVLLVAGLILFGIYLMTTKRRL